MVLLNRNIKISNDIRVYILIGNLIIQKKVIAPLHSNASITLTVTVPDVLPDVFV